MSVAKGSEELGVGVKCQANPEIAGSPRNGLRVSLSVEAAGGRAPFRCGGVEPTKPRRTPNAGRWSLGVRPGAKRFWVERGTAQTAG